MPKRKRARRPKTGVAGAAASTEQSEAVPLEPRAADPDLAEAITGDLASDAAEALRILRPPASAPAPNGADPAPRGISLVDIGAAPMRSTTLRVELPPEAREQLRRAAQRRDADDEDTLSDAPRPGDAEGDTTDLESEIEDAPTLHRPKPE